MIRTITIQLTRDQANTVLKEFMGFFDIWLDSMLQSAKIMNLEEFTAWRITSMTYHQIADQFLKKLKKPGNDITIRLSQPESCILYLMTFKLPIDPNKVWMNNLIILIRESLTNQMHLPEIKKNDG